MGTTDSSLPFPSLERSPLVVGRTGTHACVGLWCRSPMAMDVCDGFCRWRYALDEMGSQVGWNVDWVMIRFDFDDVRLEGSWLRIGNGISGS